MKLFIIQSSPPSRQFLPLRSIYSTTTTTTTTTITITTTTTTTTTLPAQH
jgi:hypothetical protein